MIKKLYNLYDDKQKKMTWTEWSNSVTVVCSRETPEGREVEACANYDLCDNPSMLYGALSNTKQQAVNEIGSINGTIVFNTFFMVEMSKQLQLTKNMLNV